MSKASTLARVTDCGVVAIIRAHSIVQLYDIAQALIDGGVIAIELTMTTPNALQGIEGLSNKYGDQCVVGVGSVLDALTAADAIRAGAQFVLSPVFNPAVVEATKSRDKIAIPGAYSPGEIYTAWKAGADVVKVFPATTLGPGYIRDLLAPMPFLKLAPTGGVDGKTAGDWIKAGAVMVGAGSSLVSKEALKNNDWAGISNAARQMVAAVKTARAK